MTLARVALTQVIEGRADRDAGAFDATAAQAWALHDALEASGARVQTTHDVEIGHRADVLVYHAHAWDRELPAAIRASNRPTIVIATASLAPQVDPTQVMGTIVVTNTPRVDGPVANATAREVGPLVRLSSWRDAVEDAGTQRHVEQRFRGPVIVSECAISRSSAIERLVGAFHALKTYTNRHDADLVIFGPYVDAQYAAAVQRYCDALQIDGIWVAGELNASQLRPILRRANLAVVVTSETVTRARFDHANIPMIELPLDDIVDDSRTMAQTLDRLDTRGSNQPRRDAAAWTDGGDVTEWLSAIDSMVPQCA